MIVRPRVLAHNDIGESPLHVQLKLEYKEILRLMHRNDELNQLN